MRAILGVFVDAENQFAFKRVYPADEDALIAAIQSEVGSAVFDEERAETEDMDPIGVFHDGAGHDIHGQQFFMVSGISKPIPGKAIIFGVDGAMVVDIPDGFITARDVTFISREEARKIYASGRLDDATINWHPRLSDD